MSDKTTVKCSECGEPLSLEVGIVNYGPEGDSKLYCEPCAPNRGKGYTLADIERMREEGKAARAAYEMSLMDKVGPDVYFAVKKSEERREKRRALQRTMRNIKGIQAALDDLINPALSAPADGEEHDH